MSARQTQAKSQEDNVSALEAVINRYDRQELIQGWDQGKLNRTRVAVIGSGIIADYVTMGLSALGFGGIEIYGQGKAEQGEYKKGFTQYHGFSTPKAEQAADFAAKINPLVKARGINISMSQKENILLLGNPDIVIDTTNNPASKLELIDYATRNNSLFISISSSDNLSKFGLYNHADNQQRNQMDLDGVQRLVNNILFTDLAGKDQDPITGMSVSALAVDEARKYVMPLKNEKMLDDVIVHSLYSTKRFDNSKDMKLLAPDELEGKKILMIGAGALGNFVGLGLAMTRVSDITIMDKDVVESTNLNRQPFFYNSVGQAKVPALINELKRINPSINYKGIVDFIVPGFDELFIRDKPDIIIDCVDNDRTRALLNYYSIKYSVPLVSSATSHNSGHVNVSVPGKTACLDCQREIDKYALAKHNQQSQQSQSCIHAPQASVVTSNMAVAGLVIGEVKAVLSPSVYGEPIKRELKYISEDDYRVGSLPINKDYCECHKDKEKIRDWPEKMKALYEKAPR